MGREEEQFERIPTIVFEDSKDAAIQVAGEIADLIRDRAGAGDTAVLGLATGSTPLPVYRELMRLHREEGLSFYNVITFNLDEYYGLAEDHPESYHQFMWDHLFRFVDIRRDQVNVPSGTTPRGDVYEACAAYEKRIQDSGGLDYQILGVGRTGHIGFNEPGSPRDSKTRLVSLDALTRRDAARDFIGEANVPRYAVTMGVGTVLAARKIVLMAWGQAKASVIKRAVEDKPSENLPAGMLQGHESVRFFVDAGAAEELTRFRSPWLVGPVDWTPRMMRKAVLWLSVKANKPILKLQDSDYNEHGLVELLTGEGGAYDLNMAVFNQTQHTITGWPGGKPNADDSSRPERAEPFPKRVLVIGSEPHEDILCVGGTIHRLHNQGNEVTLAYLTSGNLAVPDGMAKQILALMSELESELNITQGDEMSLGKLAGALLNEVESKSGDESDSPAIRQVKALVRRNEARDAARCLKLKSGQLKFLELPFYENGRYRNFNTTPEDVEALASVLKKFEPHQIYVSGSMADPDSVSGVCYRVFVEAMKAVSPMDWVRQCRVWSYRGIGQEWPLHEIDMVVPLSPDELILKVEASFQYRSQRNQFPFRDSNHKEIWQQTDEINRFTAEAYDKAGMAEYEGVEGFRSIEIEELMGS